MLFFFRGCLAAVVMVGGQNRGRRVALGIETSAQSDNHRLPLPNLAYGVSILDLRYIVYISSEQTSSESKVINYLSFVRNELFSDVH